MSIARVTTAMCLFITSIVCISPTQAEWKWELTPHLWATGVSLDASVDDMQVASTEASFSDLLDKLDFAALAHFEGRHGRTGFFVEADYFELSDKRTIVGHPEIPDDTVVRAGLDNLIGEAGGLYRIKGENSLDLLFGLRLLHMTVDLDFDFPVDPDASTTAKDDLIDAFAGLRYRNRFGERWQFLIRGDVGAGDSDVTWQAFTGLGLELGENRQNRLIFSYRHLVWETDGIDRTIDDVELVYSGPLVGFTFGF